MPEAPIDATRYGELLASVQPGLIESADEHERLLGVAEGLMEKGEDISPEEAKLLALLVLLIEAYQAGAEAGDEEEDDAESHRPPLPYETLGRLMHARGLELQDIADLFGNPHIARNVLEGKRAISRNEAKQLGRFFQVPPKLFQS